MDCRTAEGMVSHYLDHTLSPQNLEAFLNHIQYCPSCYEELETYFIVQKAMLQLDEDDHEGALDFRSLLEEDLKHARRHVQNQRLLRFFAALLICLLAGVLILFFILVVMEIRRFA